jgi:hypothetical protein
MRKLRVWATFFRGHMTQREKEGIASSLCTYTPPKKKKKKAGGRYNKKRKRISVSTPP